MADGHHRSAAASRVRALHRDRNPGHTGEESYNYFLVVLFPHDQMQILDYNRVIKDLGEQVSEVVERGEDLTQFDGIGKSTAEKPTNSDMRSP